MTGRMLTRHGPLPPVERGDRVKSLLDRRTGVVCTRTLGMPLRRGEADKTVAVLWDNGTKTLASRSLLARLAS